MGHDGVTAVIEKERNGKLAIWSDFTGHITERTITKSKIKVV